MFGHLAAILFCLSIAGVSGAAQDDISLTQQVSETSIAFEDDVSFEVILTWTGPQHRYIFDRPLSPALSGLKVGSFSTSVGTAPTDSGQITTKRFRFQLIPTRSGTAAVQPINIEYTGWPDSLPGELVTEAVTILVAAPARRPEISQGLSGWVKAAIVLAVIGIAGGLWYGAHRRRLRSLVKQTTPKDELLNGLENLQAEAGSDLKKFQTGLYQLLLTYLNDTYGILTTGRSVNDIMASLESSDLSAGRREKLAYWIERAEREKYAPVQAAPGETVRLANEIKQFFENM
jgi:hypothetical protein